jgi:hypothetical protein
MILVYYIMYVREICAIGIYNNNNIIMNTFDGRRAHKSYLRYAIMEIAK